MEDCLQIVERAVRIGKRGISVVNYRIREICCRFSEPHTDNAYIIDLFQIAFPFFKDLI
jgi:hypothetical protein